MASCGSLLLVIQEELAHLDQRLGAPLGGGAVGVPGVGPLVSHAQRGGHDVAAVGVQVPVERPASAQRRGQVHRPLGFGRQVRIRVSAVGQGAGVEPPRTSSARAVSLTDSPRTRPTTSASCSAKMANSRSLRRPRSASSCPPERRPSAQALRHSGRRARRVARKAVWLAWRRPSRPRSRSQATAEVAPSISHRPTWSNRATASAILASRREASARASAMADPSTGMSSSSISRVNSPKIMSDRTPVRWLKSTEKRTNVRVTLRCDKRR